MAKDETKLFSKSSRNLFIIAVGAGITATVLTSEWFWRLLGDSDFALWAKEKFTSDVNLHPMLFGLLLLAPFFVAWILWPKSNFSGGSTPAKGATVEVRGGDASTVMDLDALSENERVVIEYMASGVHRPTAAEVASATGLQQLVAEQALDRLYGRGLLSDTLNLVTGRHFHLAPRGRDFIIENGLLPE